MSDTHTDTPRAGFRAVSADLDVRALQDRVLAHWDAHDIFAASLRLRAEAPPFVFFEGPPTANGRPGVHHVFARTIKDAICRYQTMRGHLVRRKAGWDTHGLQVEIEVEKALGLKSKTDIEAYGVEKFNQACRDSVFTYVDQWRDMTRRIGYWVDLDDPYITLDPRYIDSVWWTLAEFFKAGLIYRGYKVLPCCPRCGTPLSSHEVAQGYDDAEDPSLVVTMPLTLPAHLGGEDVEALVWTTTPWTLPSNVACAVNPDATYAIAQCGARRVLLAEARLDFVRADLEKASGGEPLTVTRTLRGADLVELRYTPLFRYLDDPRAFRFVAGDFVSLDDGTGIVHMAPAFGADDYEMSKVHDLPVFRPIDARGLFTADVPEWQGQFIKDADPSIIEHLRGAGRLIFARKFTHTYPFCWRCDSPLIYYARDSWYIATTRYKDDLLRAAAELEWHPDEVGEGRFNSWLRGNVDWAISRDRYWGTPLPVWICASCGGQHCAASRAELTADGRLLDAPAQPDALPAWSAVQSQAAAVPADFDPHKPFIDRVVLPCRAAGCGGTMFRTPEVIDAWFDSGSMPHAQWHYPAITKELTPREFPANFIAEGIDQTRGWFYSLLAIGAFLWKKAPYRHVIANELVLDKVGQKMSKSRGNAVDPFALLDSEGPDAIRWYLLTTSPLGSPIRFDADGVKDVRRRLLGTLLNTASFFTLYANIDGFHPRRGLAADGGAPVAPQALDANAALDTWVLSRLDATVERVVQTLETYDLTRAGRVLSDFLIDDVSNWYVRRNRRRFWRAAATPADRADKEAAYRTLHEVLVKTTQMLAPFMPFVAEDLYQALVAELDDAALPSVHLTDFPHPVAGRRDTALEAEMDTVRTLVELGRAARSTSGRKVRQPLGRLMAAPASGEVQRALQRLGDIVCDELNVKSLWAVSAEEVVLLKAKGLRSELGPKHGKRAQLVIDALAQVPSHDVEILARGESLSLMVEGAEVVVAASDVQILREPKPDTAVASGGAYTVGLDTRLTPELQTEGMVREFAHRVQTARKAADFQVTDRITIRYAASDGLAAALVQHGETVREETLAVALDAALPEGEGESWSFDGETVRVAIARA